MPGGHAAEVSPALEELEALIDVSLDLLRVLDWRSENLVICLGGRSNPLQRFLHLRMNRISADTQREREVAGADEQDVESRRGRDGFDVLHRLGFLNHGNDHHVLVSEVHIAFGCRPAEICPERAEAAASMGGYSSRHRLASQLRRAGEWEHHAERSLVEHALRGPKLVDGNARKRQRLEATRGQHDVAQGFQRNGTVLHLDPQEVETQIGGLRGDFHARHAERSFP